MRADKAHERLVAMGMIRIMPVGRGDQLLSAGIKLRLGQPLRRDTHERRDLRDPPTTEAPPTCGRT
jgi:hypothetical protein